MLKKIIKSDYVITFLTEFLVLVAGVLVYKFAANLSGKDDFSEYAICRRTISFIQPLLMLGLGVGIPRYIAFSATENLKKSQGTFFVSGLLIALCILIPSLFLFNFFKEQFSFLFFGSISFQYLIPYLSIMIAGMILHAICYGYLRGRLYMRVANLIQLINIGVVPLVVFALFHNVNDVLLYTGVAWFGISSVITIIILFTIAWMKSELGASIRSLIIYGIQRVPGDLVLAGFLALPAYFTAHLVDDHLKTAGYVAFAMSLLNMAGAAFGPICLILLPKASQVILNEDFHLLKQYVRRITIWTLGLTIIGILFVELFTNQLIALYLGESFSDLVLCIRIVILSSLGYTLYISLRSILDAYYVKAVNTKNIIISFISFIIFATIAYIVDRNYLSILYGFVLSMLILGFLTYIETKKVITNALKPK